MLLQAIVLLATLGVAEWGLRQSGVVVPDKYYVWPPNLDRVFHPDPTIVEGVSAESRFVTNSDGIRVGQDPVGGAVTRVLAIGGSTTEELYLDWPDSWVGRLQRLLNAEPRLGEGGRWWIGNMGKSGSTARTNLVQARHVLPQLRDISTVLWFVGVNDAYYMLGAGYAPEVTDRAAIRLAFYYWPVGERWWESLALFRLLQEGRTYLFRSRRGDAQTDRGEWLVPRRAARRDAFANGRVVGDMPDVSDYLVSYRETIVDMAETAEANGARLVIMTQPSLWTRDPPPDVEDMLHAGGLGPPGQWRAGETQFYAPEILGSALARLNAEVLSVCATGVATCVDVAAAIPPDPRYFFDDVHYTKEGARMIADIVDQSLRAGGLAGDS